MVIPFAEIFSVARTVINLFPTAQLNFEDGNAAKLVEDFFRKQTAQVVEEFHLASAGWYLLSGRHFYVRHSAPLPPNIIADTNLDLPRDECLTNPGSIFFSFRSDTW